MRGADASPAGRILGAFVLSAALVAAPWPSVTPGPVPGSAAAAPAASGTDAPGGNPVSVSRAMFGVNVGTWDQQLADPSSIPTLQQLGVGVQQFPNAGGVYNWRTDEALDPSGRWNPQPVSLDRWGQILAATGEHGLYIVPYGFNPTGTAGESVADVQALTRYIEDHHIPVTAMVIGSEQYLGGTLNLHHDKTPQRYADLAARMAQAIHAIDPGMAVGVDLDVPENPSRPAPADLAWNRTVLSRTAPYVQFVSVHVYPIPVVQSDADLLQALHTYIAADMAFIRQQLSQYAGSSAGRLQVWITEFNPYNGASAQSLTPVFGAALTESLLLWAYDGAQQVDWWSLHGDAKAPVPVGSPVSSTYLVTDPQGAFGTFGLASEAIPPQPAPVNALYPAGQAFAQLMHLIGSGADLRFDEALYRTTHVLAFRLTHGTTNTWILINARHVPETVVLGAQVLVLPPAAMAVRDASADTPVVSGAPSPSPDAPQIASAVYDAPSGVLTVAGSGFGPAPDLTPAHSGGVDQPRLQILDTVTGASYGWVQPDQTDWYGVTVVAWTPTLIRIRFPVQPPPASDPLQISFWRTVAGQALSVAQASVGVAWLGGAPSPPTVSSVAWTGPGQLTLSGANFGPEPPTVPAGGGGVDQPVLRIHDATSGATYGWTGPGSTDYYGVQILAWTPSRITVRFVATPPAPGDVLTLGFPTVSATTWSARVPPAG